MDPTGHKLKPRRHPRFLIHELVMVRHRTGKADGFEFINPSFAQLQLIRQICTRVSYQPAAGEMA